MKTEKKSNKSIKLFNKYDKNKDNFLSQKEIIMLIKKEFKLNYDKHIIFSFMHIWGTRKNNKLYISKNTFTKKLFKKPDGFFRDIKL